MLDRKRTGSFSGSEPTPTGIEPGLMSSRILAA